MIWDESTQFVIVIDSLKVETYDAVTGNNRHKITKAHDTPVKVGLWLNNSEQIVTGCVGGTLKVWACQHPDMSRPKHSRARIIRRRRRKPTRIQSGRRGRNQAPVVVASFGQHSGAITGLIRHPADESLILSSSMDGTLRVWDVHRLSPVTTIELPETAIRLFSCCNTLGQPRLVYAGAEGRVTTMIAYTVCDALRKAVYGVRSIRYHPPLASNVKDCGTSAPVVSGHDCGRLEERRW